MFIAALLLIVKKSKQPKSSSANRLAKYVHYSHTVKLIIAVKKNTVNLYILTWKDLQDIIEFKKAGCRNDTVLHVYGNKNIYA